MKKAWKKIAGPSQHLRESEHTPNWEEIYILVKENNIVKRIFNKREQRKVISYILSAIITQIKVN